MQRTVPLRPSRTTVVVSAWSVLLAVGLLGRALAPGYVLSYDMVWVPDLALRRDVWGLASALPRAVPSDAVVALLDEVIPGSLLQKLVLLVPLVAGGLGAARLLPTRLDGLLPRLVLVGLWQWNPFVVERLVLGQWPVLVVYATVPWTLLAGRRWRTDHRLPTSLWWLVPLGSLSPSAGIATAVALAAGAAGRGRRRLLLLLVVAANAPWVAAALTHTGSTTTAAAGARAFALHGEGARPAPLAALTLGGVWNTEVVPASRTGALGWVATVVLLGLAALGARTWWRSCLPRDRTALLVCWVVGWGLGVLTWAAPTALGRLDADVPGVALLRDGGRLLLLCAPLYVVLVTAGVSVVVAWLRRRDVATAALQVVGVGLTVLPVGLLPDAAWGAGGYLRAVDYPSDYATVAAVLAARAREPGGGGDVLLLPLTGYRAPAWNGGRKVLDPLSRYLPVDVLASDALQVGGIDVSGEDPRVAEAARALARPGPEERARALAAMGVGAVVVERDAGPSPAVAGPVVASTATLTVVSLDGATGTTGATGVGPRVLVLAPAWAAFLSMPLVAGGLALRRRRRHPEPGGGSDARNTG